METPASSARGTGTEASASSDRRTRSAVGPPLVALRRGCFAGSVSVQGNRGGSPRVALDFCGVWCKQATGTSAVVASRVRQLRKRKPRPRPRASTWTIRYAITAQIAVLVAALILGLAFLGHRYLTMGIGVLLLDAFMLVTLAPLYRQHRLRVRDLGLRTTAPARAVGLVAIAFLAVAITNALWLHGVLDKPAQSLGITLHAGTIDTILIGAGLTVSAPVIEEIFFRGLLYRVLRNRMSIIPAAVIAGFVFGAVHGMAYPLNTLPPRMVFGVIACLLYERTGLPIPLHGASRTHRWQCIRSRGQPPGRDRLRRVWRSRSHPPAVCRHPALLSRPSIPASRVGDRTPHHRP